MQGGRLINPPNCPDKFKKKNQKIEKKAGRRNISCRIYLPLLSFKTRKPFLSVNRANRYRDIRHSGSSTKRLPYLDPGEIRRTVLPSFRRLPAVATSILSLM